MKKRKIKKKVKIIGIFLLLTLVGLPLLLLLPKDNKKVADTEGPTEKKTTSEKKEDRSIQSANLTLVGDFLFEQPFYDDNKDIENSPYFDLVKHYFEEDDLSIGNMEVVIGNDNIKPSGTGYNFCAPLSVGKLVSKLKLEVLSTANNHSFDRGVEGIDSTIDFFKNNTKIKTVGTYKNKEDIEKITTLTINGITFSFLSYTLGTNIRIDEENQWKVNLYRDPSTKQITSSYKEKIKKDVEKAKAESDVIVALVHWGTEFTSKPNNEQTELATFLNELGVHLIVGNHSHSIQPIEWIGNTHKTLVYYSLGNFVSADDDISRTGETYDNAYQFGLLSTLKVIKTEDSITINDIKAEPIVNYFDKDMHNFKLIPFSQYTEEYEKSHYRYSYNFNKAFITNMMNDVVDKQYQ